MVFANLSDPNFVRKADRKEFQSHLVSQIEILGADSLAIGFTLKDEKSKYSPIRFGQICKIFRGGITNSELPNHNLIFLNK